MDSNIEFLNYIYQNAEMGKNTISELITIVQDTSFKTNLESQLGEYSKIFDIASNKIQQAKKASKGIGTLTKFTTYLMINFNTIKQIKPHLILQKC